MEELFTGLANFTFPVVISVFLLVRFEKKIDKLEVAISGKDGLTSEIKDLSNKISNLKEEIKRDKQ
jgi:hypothetical protein